MEGNHEGYIDSTNLMLDLRLRADTRLREKFESCKELQHDFRYAFHDFKDVSPASGKDWLCHVLHDEQLRPGRQGAESATSKNIPHGKRGEIRRKAAYVRSAVQAAKVCQWEKEVGAVLPGDESCKRETNYGTAHRPRASGMDRKRDRPHDRRIQRNRQVVAGKNHGEGGEG